MQVDSGVGLRCRASRIVSVRPMLGSERVPASSSPSSAPISNKVEVDLRRTVSRVRGRLDEFPLAGSRALAFVHDGIAVDRSFLDERYLVSLSFVSLRGCPVSPIVWSSSIGWAVESSTSSSASRGVDEEGRHVGGGWSVRDVGPPALSRQLQCTPGYQFPVNSLTGDTYEDVASGRREKESTGAPSNMTRSSALCTASHRLHHLQL